MNAKGIHENHNPNSDKNNPTNVKEIITKNISRIIATTRNEIVNACIFLNPLSLHVNEVYSSIIRISQT
jgi:hypothetical protein